MHFSSSFRLMKLFLLLFLFLCLFWSNDSFLIWSWVTSFKITALAIAQDDDVKFSLLTTVLYALLILKSSTDFQLQAIDFLTYRKKWVLIVALHEEIHSQK
jgi:hypothetical protein